MKRNKSFSPAEARGFLRKIFTRNGYVRMKDEDKLEEQGHTSYKKGYEVRLVAQDKDELREIQAAITALQFNVSKPFKKVNQIVQPLYGRDAVELFVKPKRAAR